MASDKPFSFNPESGNGLRNHAARSAGLTIGAQVIKFGLRLASMTVLARLLSPTDYGLVAMAGSVTAVLGAMREAGLSSATVQRPGITHAQVSALFWINCGLGIAVALICLLLAPVAAWFFNHRELLFVIPCLGLTGLVGSLGIQHNAIMQRRMEFKQLMIRDLAGQICGFAAGYAAARSGAGYWSLVVMEGSSIMVSTAAIWLGCAWRPSRPSGFAEVRPMIGFGAHVTGAALLTHFSRGLDTMVLGHFYGSSIVGAYSRAQQLLSTPMGQITTPIMSVARPALSRAAEDPAKLNRITTELLGLISFCCAGIIAMLIPAADGVVRLMLGENWNSVVPIFIALAPFAIIEPAAGMLASVLVASGHAAAMLRWRIVSLFIIAGGLAFSVRWGPAAMAGTYAVLGLFVRMPQFMWLVCQKTGTSFGPMLGALIPNLVRCLFAIAGTWVIRQLFEDPSNAISTIFLVLTSAALYLALSIATSSGRAQIGSIRKLVDSARGKSAAKAQPPVPPKANIVK
jgi:O-antigen/teichoic acid export membrane protein